MGKLIKYSAFVFVIFSSQVGLSQVSAPGFSFVIGKDFSNDSSRNTNGDREVVLNYQAHVFGSYQKAVSDSELLRAALVAFVESPSELTHEFAKQQWIEARKSYSPTEIFRFYGGPIDDEDGPEGALNAWPMDEVYIDYVVGDANSGIINNPTEFPVISKQVLRDLNEKEGETNISTGFHALEFLLWGQDLNVVGPGQRSYTDYTVKKNADRRGIYLKTLGEILVEDLSRVKAEWDLSESNSSNSPNYAQEFIKIGNERSSLQKIFLSLYTLSAEELSQERIYVAYDTQQQEDEHSCFSDTTHMDVYYSYKGLQDVLNIVLKEYELKESAKAQSIKAAMENLEALTLSFPKPFDQAIFSESERPQILQTVRSLEELGEMIKEMAVAFDVSI